MKQCLIVGVDVSKSTLDIVSRPTGVAIKIANNLRGFQQWFNQLPTSCEETNKVLVIMEHTGPYSLRFESFLKSVSIGYCKIAALQIKRSLGMIRGKNDKVDAARIAEYGWLRKDLLTADRYPQEEIIRLRSLLSLRSKLVKDRSGYKARVKEMKETGGCTASDYLAGVHRRVIHTFSTEIAAIEEKIKLLIASTASLQATAKLLMSIKGIGPVIAAYMITCTDNFCRFANARKFNCYAGIAPFGNESGTSKKGKSKISHLANKEAKSLLDRAACCAIQHDQEMKTYYLRRIKEGKAKRSCINIIRAKLVARMFAVVKRQTPYQTLAPAA